MPSGLSAGVKGELMELEPSAPLQEAYVEDGDGDTDSPIEEDMVSVVLV